MGEHRILRDRGGAEEGTDMLERALTPRHAKALSKEPGRARHGVRLLLCCEWRFGGSMLSCFLIKMTRTAMSNSWLF